MSRRVQIKYISTLLFLIAAILSFAAAFLSSERRAALAVVGFTFIAVSVMNCISSKAPKNGNP